MPAAVASATAPKRRKVSKRVVPSHAPVVGLRCPDFKDEDFPADKTEASSDSSCPNGDAVSFCTAAAAPCPSRVLRGLARSDSFDGENN